MGAANNRGTRDQRVAEAVERKRIADKIKAEQKAAWDAEMIAEAKAARVARIQEDEERMARGEEKPKPRSIHSAFGSRNSRAKMSTLIAAAALSMAALG
jgi:hypothetical protein